MIEAQQAAETIPTLDPQGENHASPQPGTSLSIALADHRERPRITVASKHRRHNLKGFALLEETQLGSTPGASTI